MIVHPVVFLGQTGDRFNIIYITTPEHLLIRTEGVVSLKTQALLYYIGTLIFGGLGILTLLQLEKASYMIEAGTFIIISALLYYGMVMLYYKSRKTTFLTVNLILAILALGGIFFNQVLFGTH
jgi:hypothetical protein